MLRIREKRLDKLLDGIPGALPRFDQLRSLGHEGRLVVDFLKPRAVAGQGTDKDDPPRALDGQQLPLGG